MASKQAQRTPAPAAETPIADPRLDWLHTDALAPYARNSRTHTPEQIADVARSMRRFGWTNPLLVRNGTIIAGHARLEAAKAVWAAGEAIKNCPRPHYCPTLALDHLSEDEARAYVIADNQLALGAGWDFEVLKLELHALDEAKFDLGVLGFQAEELGELMFDSGSDGAGGGGRTAGLGSLAERFGVPPFSVLSARDGWWQDRKRAWIALGIQSELGRGELANDRGESGSARINDAADLQRKGADFGKSGAVQPIGGGLNGTFIERRKAEKAARQRANAEPGGSKRPAADYGKSKARGDGRGRAVRGAQG